MTFKFGKFCSGIHIYPLLKCWHFYQRNTESRRKADEKPKTERKTVVAR